MGKVTPEDEAWLRHAMPNGPFTIVGTKDGKPNEETRETLQDALLHAFWAEDHVWWSPEQVCDASGKVIASVDPAASGGLDLEAFGRMAYEYDEAVLFLRPDAIQDRTEREAWDRSTT